MKSEGATSIALAVLIEGENLYVPRAVVPILLVVRPRLGIEVVAGMEEG
jgi:hypothetical protein